MNDFLRIAMEEFPWVQIEMPKERYEAYERYLSDLGFEIDNNLHLLDRSLEDGIALLVNYTGESI